MPTYTNETAETKYYNNVTWNSGETKLVYFYVPTSLGLTLDDANPIVDPIIYISESVTVPVATPLELTFDPPILSTMYHLHVGVSAGTLTLQFNDATNNAVTITTDEAFDQTIYWHIAPKIILTASVEATVTIIASEMLAPIVY